MKSILFLISISITIMMTSCSLENKKGTFVLDEMIQDTTFQAKHKLSNPPSAITIHLQGKTDDSIKVDHLFFEGGKIDTSYMGDQYTGDVSISFHNYKATKGHLKISYKILNGYL